MIVFFEVGINDVIYFWIGMFIRWFKFIYWVNLVNGEVEIRVNFNVLMIWIVKDHKDNYVIKFKNR